MLYEIERRTDMGDISVITTFLGWCTIVHLGLYALSAVIITIFSGPVKSIHSTLSNIPPEKLDVLYFNFLGNYKLAIIITSLVPYVALKVMAS